MNIDEQKTLLKRAKMCLEDKDYIKADELCEKVLNSDPECAEAYFIKFLSSQKASTLNDILEKNIDISKDTNFNRATQFAEGKLKDDILQYKQYRDKANLYSQARKAEITAFSPEACVKVSKMYEELGDFKDSKERAQACLKKTDQVKDDKKYLKKILIVGGIFAFIAIVGHFIFDAKNEIDTVEKFDEVNRNIIIDKWYNYDQEHINDILPHEKDYAEKSRFKNQELVLTGTFIGNVKDVDVYPTIDTMRNAYGRQIPYVRQERSHHIGYVLGNSTLKGDSFNPFGHSDTYNHDVYGKTTTLNIFLTDDKLVRQKLNAIAPRLGDKLKVKAKYFAVSYRKWRGVNYILHRFIIKDILDVKRK